MMEKVYSKADKVIVWLGDSYEDVDQALEWCKRISHCTAGRVLVKISSRPNLLNKRERRQAAIQFWEFTMSCVFCHLECRKINLRC
jgi:hypothetical protein